MFAKLNKYALTVSNFLNILIYRASEEHEIRLSCFFLSFFFSRKIVDLVQVFIPPIFNPYENRNKSVEIIIEIFSSTKLTCIFTFNIF